MMFTRLSRVALVLVAVVSMAACRTSSVYNVVDAPVTISTTTASVQAADVRNAIVRAGAALGWQMKDDGPGRIVGTLHLRDHMAQVVITYSVQSYSINYLNSQNLKYDGGSIHSNYNGWIQRLDGQIRANLLAM